METAIEIKNVYKSFNTYETLEKGFLASFRRRRIVRHALKGVSLTVKKGEIAALLGKNGSGKSTFIKLLSGILYPDSGSLRVLGLNPWKDRKKLALRLGLVMGAHGQLYSDLPAIDTFNFMRAIYNIPRDEYEKRLNYLIELLELRAVYRRQVRTLSLGEAMKCNFVASVLHMPELVVLDEPTIGVDLPSRQALRTAIEGMREERNTTFLLTTHIVEDLAAAEKIFVLDEGKMIFKGSRTRLEKFFGNKREVQIELENANAMEKYMHFGKVLDLESNYIKLEVNQKTLRDSKFVKLLTSKNVIDYSIAERDLKPILLKLYETKGKGGSRV